MWTSLVVPRYLAGLSPAANRPILFEDFSWGYLTSAWGTPALALAGLGLVIALIQLRRFPFALVIWIGLLFLIANLGALGLPGTGFINSSSVEIMLFIPISALGGLALAWAILTIAHWLPERGQAAYRAALAILVTIVALFAGRALLPILNPVTLLFRQADLPAMQWIEEHIPPDETILINAFSWGYGMNAGSDGGYWIAPLTGRQTLPASVLYGLSNTPADIRRITQISRQAYEASTSPAALYPFMKKQGIRFIYVGARGGPLSPEALLSSTDFWPRFHQNGTWVFEAR
jgi:hypothetical protein